MKITEWFDIKDTKHLKAYRHLEDTGMWPEGFIPEEMEFPTAWHVILMSKIADAYLREILK